MLMIIVLVLAIIVLLTDRYLYRRNIVNLIKQLEEIAGSDTNQILTVESRQKDIVKLADMTNELLRDSRQSVVKMKRLNKNFRETITSISHDLRTPLTTAGGYIGMLKQDGLTEEEKTNYLDIVEERQEAVKRLLDQLFYYARIEAGEISFSMEPVDAHRVITDVIALYYYDFQNKEEEPEIQLLNKKCMILGDEDGLRRIFSNIIYNSLVHGSHSYQILSAEEEEAYCFSFSNSCEPMSSEELECVFDRFYTKDKSRNKKTTGLGLAIAKEIILKMGGTIEADYQNGIFTIKVKIPVFHAKEQE